jgi:hypothetical protein
MKPFLTQYTKNPETNHIYITFKRSLNDYYILNFFGFLGTYNKKNFRRVKQSKKIQ